MKKIITGKTSEGQDIWRWEMAEERLLQELYNLEDMERLAEKDKITEEEIEDMFEAEQNGIQAEELAMEDLDEEEATDNLADMGNN